MSLGSAPPRPRTPQLDQLPAVITTPRLRLRPFELADVDALHPLAADPELPRMMSWNAHTTREETVGFVQRMIDERARGTTAGWAIEHEGRAAGCISLEGIRWQLRAWRIDRAELGYWLAPALWGRGYMTEAATAVTRWAFDTLGLHKLTVGCIDGNVGSQRVIEKVGFRFLAIFEDDVWRDGRWWSHRRYELTAIEWGDSTRTLRFKRPS